MYSDTVRMCINLKLCYMLTSFRQVINITYYIYYKFNLLLSEIYPTNLLKVADEMTLCKQQLLR